MIKRIGLLLISGIGIAALAAACAPASSSGGDTATLTPTPTPTGSGTPTPGPSPDVTPVMSWVSPNGEQLWIEVQAVGNLTLANLATYATTCSSGLMNIGEVMTNGQLGLFVFDTAPGQSCALGTHTFVVDWKDADGNCDPCVTDSKRFTSDAAAFPAGPGILQNIEAYVAYTSTAIRFTATNSTTETVKMESWRMYDANGQVQPECKFPETTIGPSAEPALFDTCKMVLTDPQHPNYQQLIPGNAYNVFLRGTLDGGTYWEYGQIPFTAPQP